jgi:hypothetical protein
LSSFLFSSLLVSLLFSSLLISHISSLRYSPMKNGQMTMRHSLLSSPSLPDSKMLSLPSTSVEGSKGKMKGQKSRSPSSFTNLPMEKTGFFQAPTLIQFVKLSWIRYIVWTRNSS